MIKIEHLGLQIDSPLAHSGAKNFRPPNWPPPPDWSPILDANGIPQCVYSDSVWPLDVWAGKPRKLNFGDGKTTGARIDSPNADLLRLCTAWFLFGPRGCRTSSSLRANFSFIKPIFVVCSEVGILATDLMRFPNVIDKIAKKLPPSNFAFCIAVLHDLLNAQDDLGICLLDQHGISRLAGQAPNHEKEQTPYIPSRIWSYQISRLRECLTDYLAHKKRVESCFEFCLQAYAKNFGSLGQAMHARVKRGTRNPFCIRKRSPLKEGIFHGPFKDTAGRFEITQMLEKWVCPFTAVNGEQQLKRLSQYLNLVSYAGVAYLANFSLMRIDEVWNLRADCLIREKDEKFGVIHMLRGETTKTDPDADARWPVSESVTLAIEAMSHIADMRMQCAKLRDDIGLTSADQRNPYLISRQYEVWSRGKSKSYRLRPTTISYASILEEYPQLFDERELTITAEDLRIARLITPTLNPDEFRVGVPWQFGWHQLRRTGAVNMLSSGMVDEPSLQLQLKHLSRVMTLYYGRNHSRLNLSAETRYIFLKSMYEEFGRELRQLPSPQFVSPLGPERKAAIVTFISETAAVALDKAARQGKIGARRIRAGFCVKNRSCQYGGVEAIAHCLGGDNGKGCPDLLIDVEREPDIRAYEAVVDDQLRVVNPVSPRHQRLLAEKNAIGKYNGIVNKEKRRRQFS